MSRKKPFLERSLQNRPSPGYTMLEMLSVLFIVGLLIALVAGLSRHAQQVGNRRRAQAELGEIHSALQRFYLDHGQYPLPKGNQGETLDVKKLRKVQSYWQEQNEQDGQDDRPVPYETFGKLLPPDISDRDPWGNPYRYEYDPDQDLHAYELYSTGSNTNETNQRIYFMR